jgi:Centromere protein H (CENP-H)
MVAKRDALSMLLATVNSRALTLEQQSRELERQRQEIWQTLPAKAAQVVELDKALDPEFTIAGVDGDGDQSMVDPELSEELKQADEYLKKAKWEYRVVKGIASALVAGSGVDWAGDENLTAMVLEDE